MGSIVFGIFLSRVRISDNITKNDDISELILLAIGSMLVFTLIEGCRTVLGAIVSAQGLPKTVAVSNLFSMVISLGAACIFTFYKEFSIEGFWYGLSTGQSIQVLLFFYLLNYIPPTAEKIKYQ